MYTDVLRIQSPHHLPTSVFQHRLDGDYNAFTPTPSQRHAQRGSHGHMQNASFRQRVQHPQQYTAHPVSPTVANQAAAEDFCTSNGDVSEHMLRRKTPSGTLAAGYDASSIQLAARPRPAKHRLVPFSDNVEPASYSGANQSWHIPVTRPRQTSLMPTLSEKKHLYQDPTTHARQSTNQFQDQHQRYERGLEKGPQPYYGVGVDSMLHQGPGLHQHYMYGHSHEVPTVLQPMWPPCPGLTSINHGGPYGPYWPDGEFEPYRPAPLRDPRYGHQLPHNAENGNFQSGSVGRSDRGIPQTGTSHLYSHPPDSLTEHRRGWRYTKPSSFPRRRVPSTNTHDSAEWWQNDRFPPHEQTTVQGHDSAFLVEPETTGSTYVPSGHGINILQQSENIQFKERVLIWAHRAYISLIASIQQSRRTGSANHARNERQFLSNLYPKPPTQPPLGSVAGRIFNLQSDSHSAERSSERNATIANPTIPYPSTTQMSKFRLTNNPFSHQPHSLYPQRSHPRWQARKPESDFAHDSRFQQPFANGIDNSRPTTFQVESLPTMTALSALEMLSRLCHESSWQWTDGMLLGGCLAYGLGDYTRATKWYTKLLTCDPK